MIFYYHYDFSLCCCANCLVGCGFWSPEANFSFALMHAYMPNVGVGYTCVHRAHKCVWLRRSVLNSFKQWLAQWHRENARWMLRWLIHHDNKPPRVSSLFLVCWTEYHTSSNDLWKVGTQKFVIFIFLHMCKIYRLFPMLVTKLRNVIYLC